MGFVRSPVVYTLLYIKVSFCIMYMVAIESDHVANVFYHKRSQLLLSAGIMLERKQQYAPSLLMNTTVNDIVCNGDSK